MAFARREAEDLLPMDLGHGVREMEATLRLLVPRAVNLRIEVAPGEPLIVRTSRLRLEQMLVNLVANAGDAMPRGGKLTIRVQAAPGGEQAMVEVIDSGQGMGPETLERIFEPFFTTKAPGKGTGLGLSSLRAMLDESGGHLTVHSELGKGSRFRILLPVMPALELNPR
jgi:signal transduction histidine kinase